MLIVEIGEKLSLDSRHAVEMDTVDYLEMSG